MSNSHNPVFNRVLKAPTVNQEAVDAQFEQITSGNKMTFEGTSVYKIFCSIVVYPVIPKGHIIYRLIPTAEHTQEEIDLTLKAFSETKAKLDAGAYKSEEIPDMANK